MVRALGIDLSARRGLDLALLDGLSLVDLVHLPNVSSTLTWILSHVAHAVIGIDAPQGYRLPIMRDPARRAALIPSPPAGRYLRHRVCDYELARRGIALYLSPELGEPVPEWIAVGFALFDGLRASGFRLPSGSADRRATLLEVYPYAAFVMLLGAIPARKSTPEGAAARRVALERVGIRGLPERMGHDQSDAIAAACSAWAFATGNGCAVGDVEEGLMALPVPEHRLLPRYRKLA